MKIFPKALSFLIALSLLGLSGCAEKDASPAPKKQTEFPAQARPVVLVLEKESAPASAAMVVPPPRARILFTGDIHLGRCIASRTLSASVRQGNFHYPFEHVADFLREADITVGSLDGSLSDAAQPLPCSAEKNLLGPSRMAEGLQFSGFDVITVATNHIKDCGELGYNCENRALFDTLETLRLAGIQPVGAGATLNEARQPVVLQRNGIRFAFLGINEIEKTVWAGENAPGTAPLSEESIAQIEADIAAAKKIADVVIVLPQWGVEYAPAPVERQREWARRFIEAGAALVVGNHPHVAQPMEIIAGRPVFYALGNFVFDQEQSYRRESVVVEVVFAGKQLESWSARAANINYYTFQTSWAESPEAEKIISRLQAPGQ